VDAGDRTLAAQREQLLLDVLGLLAANARVEDAVDALAAHPPDARFRDVGLFQHVGRRLNRVDGFRDDRPRPAPSGLRDRVQRTRHEDAVLGPGRIQGDVEGAGHVVALFDVGVGFALEGRRHDLLRLGTVDGGLAGHHVVRCRQGPRDPRVILVDHRAGDHVEGVVLECLQGSGHLLDPGGIVRAVEDDKRRTVEHLEASRPVGPPEPVVDRLPRERAHVRVGQFSDHLATQGCRDARVDGLMGPQQRQPGVDLPVGDLDAGESLQIVPAPVGHANRRRRVVCSGVRPRPLLGGEPHRRDRTGHVANGREGVPGRRRHERPVRGRDVGHVPGDLGIGLAEDRGVFERDGRDGTRDRIDDARRVVAAADPDFKHRDVDVMAAELPQRHRCQRLEEGGRGVRRALLGDVAADRLQEFHEGCLRERPAVHPDPFVDGIQVR